MPFFLPYLRFSHSKDELLRAFFSDAGLPLLAGDHHEVVTTATKSDDRLVGVGEQRILYRGERVVRHIQTAVSVHKMQNTTFFGINIYLHTWWCRVVVKTAPMETKTQRVSGLRQDQDIIYQRNKLAHCICWSIGNTYWLCQERISLCQMDFDKQHVFIDKHHSVSPQEVENKQTVA